MRAAICRGIGDISVEEIDEPTPQAPAGGACNSATLGKAMPEGSCVQSSSTQLWYQCEAGQWYRGVSNGSGPYGKCTTTVGL